MRRHAIFEGIQVLLHALGRHAPRLDFIQQLLIIVDTLTSGRDLKSVEQKIKAQSKGRIRRIVHRVKRTLLRRIVCDKHEVCIVLFLEILTDQGFLLRLQVIRIADLPVVFFCDQLFCPVKTYHRNLFGLRKGHTQDPKLLGIFLREQLHRIL